MIAMTEHWQALLLWGLIASGAMATLLEGAQLLGFSRMSLPYLFGAFLFRDGRRVMIAGYLLYLAGALIFAFLYAGVLTSLTIETPASAAMAGTVFGFLHGIFLIVVFLPLLPYIHPRLASNFDGPEALGKIEPPGPFGLNYGRMTPLSTVAAQTLYGIVFSLGFSSAITGAG